MKYSKDLIVCFLLFLVLCFGKESLDSSKEALLIWFEKLVPSMFVSLVLIRVVYHRHILERLRIPFMAKLFHMDNYSISLVLCIMFLGFPNGALFIDEAYQEHRITKEGAKRLLYTCSFAAPGFVIMTCGALLFQSIQVGVQLFLAQILSGIILLLFTKSTPLKADKMKTESKSFMFCIRSALLESGKALYMMGGYLMLFMSVASVIFHFLPESISLPLRILSEFSSGVVLMHKLPYSPIILQLLTCMLLSFGGFCVHMQVRSMAEHISYSYRTYFLYRILQSILALGIFLLLLFFH